MTREQAFERIADLEAEVAYLRAELDARASPEDVTKIQGRFSLSPHEAIIVAELLRVYPKAVPDWVLLEKLPPRNGHRDDLAQNSVKVRVSHIRHKLGKDVIENFYSHGYALSEAWAAKLKDAVA